MSHAFRTLVLALSCLFVTAEAQERPLKRGLEPADYVYKLAPGVTTREVTYYSDDVACFAKLFFPKNFDPKGKTPAVVLGHGWAGTHYSIEKYAARFAEKGLVAMVIDYRGWGRSDGFTTLANRQPIPEGAKEQPLLDEQRFTRTKTDVVIKRTRLIPMKQVEDYRNAISYIQGEPGVDPERIGIWGSSFAGGNVIVVAATDARVKAVVGQIPAIRGKGTKPAPFALRGPLLEDAITRARTGQGKEMRTGFSVPRDVDVETNQAVAEYAPFHYLDRIGDRPVMFIVAEKEELFRNSDNAYAAAEVLTGPKKVVEVPGITHFEMYIGEAFEMSSKAAADWFVEHLK